MTEALQQDGRLEKLAPWLVAVLVLAVAIWAAQPYPVGVFHDDGVYATLARAIAGGDGFRYLSLPGAPPATHYPPIYPLVLSAAWKLAPDFPRNIPTLQLVNAVALAIAGFGMAVFARRSLGWTHAAAAVAAVVATLSYPLIGLSGYLTSEPLFVALLFPALGLSERATSKAALSPTGSRDAWIAGAAVGVLTLVRTHGIALVGALVIVLAWRRRWWPAAFVVAAAALVLAPWQLFVAAHDQEIAGPLRGKYASYLPWLIEGWRGGVGFVAATVVANVREVIALLADRFSLSDHALPRTVTGLAASAFVVAGAISLGRRATATAVFAALYVIILLLWPFSPWRFLFAFWPVVILCLGEAVRRLAGSGRQAAMGARLGLVLATVLALGVVRAETRAYREQAWHEPARRAARGAGPLILWIEAHTRPDDVVAVESEQLVYLFTGRRAVPPQVFTAAEYVRPRQMAAAIRSLRAVLSELPVTYVVTADPLVFRSARLLSESADAVSVPTRLVQIPGPRSGGAFRVERDHVPTTQP